MRPPGLDHLVNGPGVSDVDQRVEVEDHQIGTLPASMVP